MKFKVGDIVLAAKKSMPRRVLDKFLQLSPLGIGIVVSTSRGRNTGTNSPIPIVRVYPIRDESALFFFREEDLIFIGDTNK
jgi:hypothetical protein